jgi:hypothetical protein
MTDETIIHGQTVLVKGTRITAIGLSNTIDIPDDSMVIDGSNSYLIEKKDFTYLHRLRDFWIKIPGRPQIGTYTIEVTSVKDNGLASDIQGVIKTIPLPEIKYFTPLKKATLK